MKAYEFPVQVSSDGKLELPNELLEQLPDNRLVRIIILVDEPSDIEDEQAWARFTAQQFFAGYDEADAIYDQV